MRYGYAQIFNILLLSKYKKIIILIFKSININ